MTFIMDIIEKRKYNKEHPKTKEQRREEYQRNKESYLKKKKIYYKNNKEKYKIWNKINYELKKKGLKLAECSKCKTKENLIKHHTNYLKPYDYIILCRGCHNGLHHTK